MFGSGIRGAADVFKALALGAKFGFVGRRWVWDLSIKGEIGVRHMMNGLLAGFDIFGECYWLSVCRSDHNGAHQLVAYICKHDCGEEQNLVM